MHTNTKILIGFLAIILLSMSQVVITNNLQSGILIDARQVSEVEQPLEKLVFDVRYHDEVLSSEVTRITLHAMQNDSTDHVIEHRSRYDASLNEIDQLIEKDIPILLRQSERSQDASDRSFALLAEVSNANAELTRIEGEVLALVDEGAADDAFELLHAGEYDRQKSTFRQAVSELSEQERAVTQRASNSIFSHASRVIYVNLALSMIVTFLVIVVLFVIRSFVRDVCKKEF